MPILTKGTSAINRSAVYFLIFIRSKGAELLGGRVGIDEAFFVNFSRGMRNSCFFELVASLIFAGKFVVHPLAKMCKRDIRGLRGVVDNKV